jgi:hypothetical protein
MKMTIVYPQDCSFQIDIPQDAQETPATALSYAWEACNPDSGNTTLDDLGLRIRSSMVGDIYILDGQHWMVDGRGFVQLTPVDSIMVQRMPVTDRLMGWDWCADRNKALGLSLDKIK